MFEYIKGKLADASPLQAVIDVNGIGYQLLISLSTYSRLPAPGKELLFYVTPVIREDSHKLYGFLTKEERTLFEKFIDVSGIGPKTALALLGHMTLGDLQLALAQGDVNLLCKAPGIGKKTAERLVVEMRDKVKLFDIPVATFSSGGGKEATLLGDAMSALAHLGYNPVQAQKAVRAAMDSSEKELSLPELITSALRNI